MGTTRIYFVAAVLLFVLNGACLVKGTNTTMAPGNSTSDGNSTSGMTSVNMPADSDIGTTDCLVCEGNNSSNCNHASPTRSMKGISVQRGCRSCRVSIVIKSDTGKGTSVTQVERKCDQDDSCPEDLIGEYDYNLNCFYTATHHKCEWCCQKNDCNNFSRNSANALVAAVVLGGWTITKVVYVVVSTVAVAISMSIVV